MDKGPDAFRTISEVADDLDLPQHVLRFWETRFAQIKPLKRGGGRRYYRPDDVALLRGIRHLLYGRGYTIKGVQRILKEEGLRSVQAIARGERDVAEPDAGQEDAGADRRLPEAAAVAPERPHEAGEPLWEPAAPPSKYVLPQREAALEPARASIAQKPANAMIERGLSANDVARLRTALEDLAECERVLALIRPASGSGSAHEAD